MLDFKLRLTMRNKNDGTQKYLENFSENSFALINYMNDSKTIILNSRMKPFNRKPFEI